MKRPSIIVYGFIFLFVFTQIATARDTSIRNDEFVAEQKRFNVGLGLSFGQGFEEVLLGVNPNNDQILGISGGGGAGVRVNAGIRIIPLLELNLMYIYQSSLLSGYNVSFFSEESINGEFNRSIFLFTPKLVFKTTRRSRLKVGAGLGYYGPGEFIYQNIDTVMFIILPLWPITDEKKFHYRGGLGYHISVEFEYFIYPSFSFCIGGKYYDTGFTLTSIVHEGEPYDVTDEMREFLGTLDGKGFDYVFSLVFYL